MLRQESDQAIDSLIAEVKGHVGDYGKKKDMLISLVLTNPPTLCMLKKAWILQKIS